MKKLKWGTIKLRSDNLPLFQTSNLGQGSKKMVYANTCRDGTYVYDVSSNYFHLFISDAPDKEMLYVHTKYWTFTSYIWNLKVEVKVLKKVNGQMPSNDIHVNVTKVS